MSNLEKINVLTKDKLDSLDLTQYHNQIFGTTDEVAEGSGSGVVSNEAIDFAESERLKTINLFNKDNPNILHAYTNGGDGVLVEDNASVTVYIKCKPNTTYTAQKIAGQQNNLSWTNVTSAPTAGTPFYDRVLDATGTTATLTTGNDATYLLYVVKSGIDTLSEQEILNSVQIEEGSVATEYQEYNGAIIHDKDIQPHIITAKLIAYHQPSQNGVLEVLPLIEHKRIGSKLSVNSSGGIVIGDGVKTIKASALARSNFGGYAGSMRLDICKNRTWYAGGRNVQKGAVLNIVTLSIEPILIEVNSGDVITLEFRRDDSSYAHVEGYTVPISTYMTVEVVE